jgi:PadR family transcriptional regulator, regulatory protein PadR
MITIPLNGARLRVRLIEAEVSRLKLDPENPRLHSAYLTHDLPARPNEKQIAAVLEQLPEFQALLDAITRNDGVFQPPLLTADFFTFPLLTERIVCILISVTDGDCMSKPTDLVQGTLDLLILKILALEPLHGWAISQRLKQVSGDVLQVSDGSLYPALHKLEQEGWITAEWKPSENNRRAKFYRLTRPGRKQLEKEAANWARLSTAISHVAQLEEA